MFVFDNYNGAQFIPNILFCMLLKYNGFLMMFARQKYNWMKLESQQVKDEFQLKLSNRFTDILHIESITERYDVFENTTREV